MKKSATTSYLTGLCEENCKEMAERFIEEHEELLHKISWNIYEKSKAYSITADKEDVFVDCVIAVYDIFENFAEHDVSVKNNEVSFIIQAVRFRTLESVWEFHKGASMPYATMKQKRHKTGEVPVEIRPYYGGLMSSFGSKSAHRFELEDMYAVQETLKALTAGKTPEQTYIEKEELQTLPKACEKLSKTETLVIETIYNNGLSLAEAGKELGLTKSATFFAEKKALAKMREEYDLIANINGRFSQK